MNGHRWTSSLLLLVAVLSAARGVDAADVLVFNSTRFVDSGQGSAYPVGSQESDNVQAALQALGHTVTTIAGPHDPTGACSFGYSQPGTVLATAAQYQAALASADVFHIPEQESWCYLPGELQSHSDIVAVWRAWVASGGGLVIHSSREAMVKVADLLEVVFGFNGIGGVDGTGVTTTKRATAQGTLFAGGPATLPGNESTGVIPLSTLPAGAVSIYDDGTHTSVAIIPFGAGKIVFLGWDWTYSEPAFPGHLNGGWYPLVLDGAVKEAASKVLTVALAGAGGGTVSSSTPAFDSTLGCQPVCRAHYPRGADVHLTATPAAGAVFRGWSGGGCTGTDACVLTLTADTTVTATFDPSAGEGLGLTVAVNQPQFSAGDRLVVSVGIDNPGIPAMADLYCGLLLPDGETIVFFTDTHGGAVFGRVSSLATFRAIAIDMPLTSPLSVTAADLFEYTWNGSEARGRYTFFMAAFAAGSLADGRMDPGDLLAVGIAPFDFEPGD